jgi:hypothetical protein
MRQLGGTFGIAIASVVFTARGGFASPAAVSSGFRGAMLAAVAFSVVGVLAGIGLPGRRRESPLAASQPEAEPAAVGRVPELWGPDA